MGRFYILSNMNKSKWQVNVDCVVICWFLFLLSFPINRRSFINKFKIEHWLLNIFFKNQEVLKILRTTQVQQFTGYYLVDCYFFHVWKDTVAFCIIFLLCTLWWQRRLNANWLVWQAQGHNSLANMEAWVTDITIRDVTNKRWTTWCNGLLKPAICS